MNSPLVMEIVPGKSIGEAKLGAKVKDLPSRAMIQPPGGTIDDLRLLINAAGEVEDIWVEDVRVFPHEIRYQGKSIPRDITIESLSDLFGQCNRVTGIKGGIFYNCANGLAIATDFSRKTLQVRVKPISTNDGT